MDGVKGGYKPSHPGLFTVKFVPGNFASSIIAQSAFQAGQTLVSLEGKKVPDRTYYTVQCGPNPEDHLDLTSDLLYVNHSCEPNVAFDLSSPNASEWNVRALKSIQPGDSLTFFYPSTEWEMTQPFQCTCRSKRCLKTIRGAAFLSDDQISGRGFINPWIIKIRER